MATTKKNSKSSLDHLKFHFPGLWSAVPEVLLPLAEPKLHAGD